MRKWILKGTTLKTPFHIAFSRMKLRSQCTFSGSNFCYARDDSPFILGTISKTGMCLLTWLCFQRFTVFDSQLAKVSKELVLGLF